MIMTTLILAPLLAYRLNAHPLPGKVSAVGMAYLGAGFIYCVIQSATAAILS